MAHDPIPRSRIVRVGPARHVLRATHARGYIGTGAMCATCPRIDRERALCTLFAEPIDLLEHGGGARRCDACMRAEPTGRAILDRMAAARARPQLPAPITRGCIDHPEVPRHAWERRIELDDAGRECER